MSSENKQTLSRWQAAVLVSTIRIQIENISYKINHDNKGCGNLITNAEIDDLGELMDKIDSSFEINFSSVKERLSRLHRYIDGEGADSD